MALLQSWKYWRFQPVRVAQLSGNFLPRPQPQGHGEGRKTLWMLRPLLTALRPRSGSKVYDSEFMMFRV